MQRPRALIIVLLLALPWPLLAQENRALVVASPGDFVEIPDGPLLRPDQFTIEAWFQRAATIFSSVPDYPILSKPGLSLGATGHNFPHDISWSLEGNDGVHLRSERPIWPNRWYHVAAVYDGTTAKLYVDGVLADSADLSWSFPSDPGSFSVGRWISALYGTIDELRFWSVARSASEIREALHQLTSDDRTGLVGYWKFDDDDGSIAADSSGNGLHGEFRGNVRTLPADSPVDPILVSTPENVHLVVTGTSAALTWSPVASPKLAAYAVHRSSGFDFQPNSANQIALISRSDTAFTQSLSSGDSFFYRIVARDSIGNAGKPSISAFAKISPEPHPITVLSPYYLWNDTSGAVWSDGYLRSVLDPPQRPALGEYAVHDTTVVRQHVQWSRTYGIDVWMCDWLGADTPGDRAMRSTIVPELGGSDVRFGIQYDAARLLEEVDGSIPSSDENLLRLEEDFAYLAATYFGSESYFRHDGRPVVFLRSSRLMREGLDAVLQLVRTTVQAAGYELFIIGDEVRDLSLDAWSDADSSRIAAFDAISTYSTHHEQNHTPLFHNENMTTLGTSYERFRSIAERSSISLIPTIMPGYNDRGWRPSDSSAITPRNAHRDTAIPVSTLEYQWQIARPFIDTGLNMVMVSSFNGFHEDSQVEPLSSSVPTASDVSGSQLFTGYFAYSGRGTELLSIIQNNLKPDRGEPVSFSEGVHVAAYYYQWYGLDFDFHWQPYPSYLGQVLDPPIHPFLGEYDSNDPETIETHIGWSEEYGIDTWIMVYPAFSNLIEPTETILSHLHGRDVTFSFLHNFGLWPTNSCDDPETLQKAIDEISFIADNYFDHPNFWRIDGKPVLVFYLANNYAGDCTALMQSVRAYIKDRTGHDMHLFGDVIAEVVDSDRVGPWDGYTGYGSIPQVGYPDTGAYAPSRIHPFGNVWDYMDYSWWIFSQAAREKNLDFMPTLTPGSNFRAARPEIEVTPENPQVLSRQANPTASHTSTFERSIDISSRHLLPHRPMIAINSFNEWHEWSQIEPTTVTVATDRDTSATGSFYSLGYFYQGQGFDFLEIIRDRFGSQRATGIDDDASIPAHVVLHQNYPNPFNARTTIRFDLPSQMDVELVVYNLLGQEVDKLIDERMDAGRHAVIWDQRNVASGMYLYRLSAGDVKSVKKLVLLK